MYENRRDTCLLELSLETAKHDSCCIESIGVNLVRVNYWASLVTQTQISLAVSTTISAAAVKSSRSLASLNEPTTVFTPYSLNLSAFCGLRMSAVISNLSASGWLCKRSSTELPMYPSGNLVSLPKGCPVHSMGLTSSAGDEYLSICRHEGRKTIWCGLRSGLRIAPICWSWLLYALAIRLFWQNVWESLVKTR